MSEQTTLAALLIEAREFVIDLSNKEKSHESFATQAIYIPPAEELRLRADQIEQRDALIERARKLLPRIEEALRRE